MHLPKNLQNAPNNPPRTKYSNYIKGIEKYAFL